MGFDFWKKKEAVRILPTVQNESGESMQVRAEDIVTFENQEILPVAYKKIGENEFGIDKESQLPVYNVWDFEKQPPDAPKQVSENGFMSYTVNDDELIRTLWNLHGIPIPTLEARMNPTAESEGKKNTSSAGFKGVEDNLLEIMSRDNAHALGSRVSHRLRALHLKAASAIGQQYGRSGKNCFLGGAPMRFSHRISHGMQFSPLTEFDGEKVRKDIGDGGVSGSQTIEITRLDIPKGVHTVDHTFKMANPSRVSTLNAELIERWGIYQGNIWYWNMPDDFKTYRIGPNEIDVLFDLNPDYLAQAGHARGMPEWLTGPVRQPMYE